MKRETGYRILSVFAAIGVALTGTASGDMDKLVDRKITSENGKVSLLEHVLDAEGPSEAHVRKVFSYFDDHIDEIDNRDYVTIIDYALPNKEPRMFVIDLNTGDVEKRLVSHGAGRDDRSNPRDVPEYFSNEPGSRLGSLGFFITGEEYPSPKFERAMNLHGREESNSNAYERRIVFHGADYVDEEEEIVGRSWGCPAVDNRHAFRLIDQLKDGSLFYIAGD